MSTPEPVLLSWSGGKDSALALDRLRRDPDYQVVGLLTSVAAQFGRISHHGVREELLNLQADSIDLPLTKIYLPSGPDQPCTNAVYETIMEQALLPYRAQGVQTVAFGDLFLADLRAYREQNLNKVGMTGHFPLWGEDTTRLAARFVDDGFQAYLCCVEASLGESFAGRQIDHQLLADLPADCDPCGERGEYHSFVFAGPIFRAPLNVAVGEIVCRDGRYYADIVTENHLGHSPVDSTAMPPVR